MMSDPKLIIFDEIALGLGPDAVDSCTTPSSGSATRARR